MPRYFLDSSALVKRYHQESGSDKLDALFFESSNRFFISRLAVLEIHSCFARLVRERVLTVTDFENVIAMLETDVRVGAIAIAALSTSRLREAAELLRTHALTNPLRTLDAIHLATALVLNGRAKLTALVAADQRLLVSAAALGLTVLDVS